MFICFNTQYRFISSRDHRSMSIAFWKPNYVQQVSSVVLMTSLSRSPLMCIKDTKLDCTSGRNLPKCCFIVGFKYPCNTSSFRASSTILTDLSAASFEVGCMCRHTYEAVCWHTSDQTQYDQHICLEIVQVFSCILPAKCHLSLATTLSLSVKEP